MYINIAGASRVQIVANTTNSVQTRLLTTVSSVADNIKDYVTSEVWVSQSMLPTIPSVSFPVSPAANQQTVNLDPRSLLPIAGGLQGGKNYTLRVFNSLEPSYEGTVGSPGTVTFYGFLTDGDALAPSAPKPRNIEIVGDSITVGYGSLGGGPCTATPYTEDNFYTYDRYLCDNFTANCTVVAFSGKGMYENCCDNGETMPAYYLQTLGGASYSQDWDFGRFTPDAMLINLGTNDFNHDAGQAWEWAFTSTYVQFIRNVTALHYPGANITFFLAQGPMNDSPNLYNCLQNATAQVKAAGIRAFYLDMRGPPNDGCAGHPGRQGHQDMFSMAQPQIAQAMGW